MDIPVPIYNLTLLLTCEFIIHPKKNKLHYIIEHVEELKTNKEQQQYETIVVGKTTLNIKKPKLVT
jgi:hypothetical protein